MQRSDTDHVRLLCFSFAFLLNACWLYALHARFLLDPFRQSSWGFSAGGGISLLAREGDHVRPQLLVALDLEGPRSRSGVSPSIQVGLGGGVRAGIGLRWGSVGVR